MDVRNYNDKIVPQLNSARAFLNAFHNALDKSGPEAKKQMQIIGWDEEMKNFLLKALDTLESEEKCKLGKRPPMRYLDAVKLIVLAANNGILRRDKGNVFVYRDTGYTPPLHQEGWYCQPISEVAAELMNDPVGQQHLIAKLKEKGVGF